MIKKLRRNGLNRREDLFGGRRKGSNRRDYFTKDLSLEKKDGEVGDFGKD